MSNTHEPFDFSQVHKNTFMLIKRYNRICIDNATVTLLRTIHFTFFSILDKYLFVENRAFLSDNLFLTGNIILAKLVITEPLFTVFLT